MIKKHIPNLLTCCNLICGVLAIINIGHGNIVAASVYVFAALVFDFFDGFIARMLQVQSPIGKDLDSLADMVTFGVVPGLLLLYQYKSQHAFNSEMVGYVALLIPVFSALRLAKFNNDARQSDSFIGVPTPANTILIVAVVLIAQAANSPDTLFFMPRENVASAFLVKGAGHIFSNKFLFSFFCGLMSYLLVAEIPLFALKFKNFGWADNKVRYIFLAISLLLILWLFIAAIPVIIFLYILLSIINRNWKIENRN